MPRDSEPSQPIAERTRRGLKRGSRLIRRPPIELPNRIECIDENNHIMAIVIESERESSHHYESANQQQQMEQVEKDSSNEDILSEGKDKKDLRKGRFTPQEQRILTDAVGQFLTISGIKYQDFLVILHQKNVINTVLRKSNFYKIISKALPNRSTTSCYRFVKRCFGDNKKGKWTKDQTEHLIDLVRRKGRQWEEIGKILGRSSECVYDKYKTLKGGEDCSVKNQPWQVREFISLLLWVNRRTDLKFLDQKIREQRQRELQLNARELQSLKQCPYNSANSILPFIEMSMKYVNSNIHSIAIEKIPWSGISLKIAKRSLIECKNKFLQVFEHAIKCKIYNDERIVDFLLEQDAEHEDKIEWEKWNREDLNYREAKNRFFVLKKTVKERSHKTFREVLQEIKRKMLIKRGQEV